MVLSKVLESIQHVSQRNMGNFRHYEGTLKDHDLRAFTFKGMRKNVAVIPLVVIMGVAVVGLTSFIVYCGKTRADISFNRNNPQISDSMDMMNPAVLRMRVVRQEYKPMPELAAGLEVVRSQQ